MNRQILEQRLIDFAVQIVKIINTNSADYAYKHLSMQLLRSSTSVALNFGEAQSAESTRDFTHKMKISLKELRESHVNLRIMKKAEIIPKGIEIDLVIDECNQLISIFVKSLQTSKSNSTKRQN